VHCAQFVQSHALAFFYLSAPDLLLGMDSDPAARNVLGVVAQHPDLARSGIELRKFGLQIIETLAQERVHPSWIVPGGVATSMTQAVRDKIAAELLAAKGIAERTLTFFKSVMNDYAEELATFGTEPTMYAGMVDGKGQLQLYDGVLRFRNEFGSIAQDQIPPEDYRSWIAEASLRESYLKAPYFKPKGVGKGVYRVGPLARLNVAEQCGTLKADAELAAFRKRFGAPAHSAFLYHYARLIEIVYALERIESLLRDPAIMETHVRANAGVNALEGVGMIEAPRGVLIHHYKVNEQGAITWANLIVATGHNNLAVGKGVEQVAKHFVKGAKLEEGMLNRVSALVRAYDPCLSCSTHALGRIAIRIRLVGPDRELLDEMTS
jgi:NAD-reducing hydrogenase large subunit